MACFAASHYASSGCSPERCRNTTLVVMPPYPLPPSLLPPRCRLLTAAFNAKSIATPPHHHYRFRLHVHNPHHYVSQPRLRRLPHHLQRHCCRCFRRRYLHHRRSFTTFSRNQGLTSDLTTWPENIPRRKNSLLAKLGAVEENFWGRRKFGGGEENFSEVQMAAPSARIYPNFDSHRTSWRHA